MKNNSTGLVYFFKNKSLFLKALIIGAVLGGTVAMFTPARYRSIAIVYPYNTHTRDEIISNPQFGYETETEQLMQMLESRSMRDRTIDKFKLYDYYKLDTTQSGWRSNLNMKYVKDITFLRSKYLSVVISATTTDPEFSAKLANFQIQEVNRYREDVFADNRRREFRNLENKYLRSEKTIGAIKDSIYSLKSGNDQLLYNFMHNLNNENYDSKEFVDDPKLEALVNRYFYELGKYNHLRKSYDHMKEKLDQPLPSVYSIDEAVPTYKKVSPSTALYVLIGGILLMVLVLAFRLILDKYLELKQEVKE